MQLRKIVIGVVISTFALIVIAIMLSLFWPPYWNDLLCSTLLNIIASLIGVTVGILVAIFIVERYLENQIKLTQKIQQLKKEVHKESINALIRASISAYLEGIMHLSYFLIYGRKKWIALENQNINDVEVPGEAVAFMAWLMKIHLDEVITEEQLLKLKNGFDETMESPIMINDEDFSFFIDYIELCTYRIKDFLFLLQPFIEEYFKLVEQLVSFAFDLKQVVINRNLYRAHIRKEQTSSYINDHNRYLIQSISMKTIKILELILPLTLEIKVR